MASIDAEVVKHALQVARDYGFAEVELVNGETQFRASLEPVKKKPKPVASDTFAEVSESAELLVVKSHYVGYIRLEDAKLAVGQAITAGEIVASISTLGLANDVESTVTGEVVEVLVKDGDPVQFGEILAKVKP